MRPQHTPHSLDTFPIYSSGFLSPTHFVLGGGGGSSRTGILNKLRVYSVADDRSITLVNELELERGEDAPMSIATSPETGTLACGVNSAPEQLAKGENQNCRAYAFKEEKLALLGTHGTLTSGDLDDYQRVTVLSPDGKMLAIGGTTSLQVVSYPSLTPLAPAIKSEAEIYDTAFSQNTLVVTTTRNLLVYALPSVDGTGSPSKTKKKGKQKAGGPVELELLQTIEAPEAISKVSASDFRAARFHPENSQILYSISNTIPGRSRNRKPAPRQAYICTWNTSTWKTEKVKRLGDKSVTCFIASPNGKYLAFADSGCRIGLLDATSLAPLATILTAHEFPATTLAFNPTSTLLVSGSPDKVVRVINIPSSVGKSSWTIVLIILLTLLIVLLAIAAQQLL
ncbi:WD-REPEATS-REGION domain-containing protein [Mycena indigotica]|uniref:WD-REPEATS-REGION domain-containing protein n=1 Tax=Mycena indigotica TaxID=2126181 RepID=A0A8H6SKQ5_9AGAR|nr:WD-REPEATS-REGION domain-containing protein [Mycena indigotica]KAF7301408.1 WD-REPEATS-REGION domain-containing protein [Mycena indigotica]